jgi:hypothetical protein
MSEQETDKLERELAELTTWSGGPTELWRGSLGRAGAGTPWVSIWTTIARMPIPRAAAMLALGAIGMVVLAIVGSSMFPVGSARMSGHSSHVNEGSAAMSRAELAESLRLGREIAGGTNVVVDLDSPRSAPPAAAPENEQGGDQGLLRGVIGGTPSRFENEAKSAPDALKEQPSSPADRAVIRKATIELSSKDVRAAFLKTAMLVSEAQGEYMQESSLTGTGPSLYGTMTLRVAAPRLSEVLNALRAVGEVRAESSGGEDVTAQVVDLEARLRNEQRVETELLDLLAKRDNAPLKEVLELRDKISEIRQHIEQLTAQRERLGRLVSLATVLVMIRAEDRPAEPVAAGDTIGDYFVKRIGAAWRSGLVFLSNTVAGLVGVAVGGALWWVLAGVLLLWARRLWKKAAAAPSPGP